MDIRVAFGLIVDFKADWCQHLILGPDSTVVEVAFPDDPSMFFNSLTHTGIIFAIKLLHTQGAAIRIRLSKQDVIIVAECENEFEMHTIKEELERKIHSQAHLFSMFEETLPRG